MNASAGTALDRLVKVIGLLRDHCPWTAALTHESLVEYLIEESYELVDAVETGHTSPEDAADLLGELGDVLMQVVLHARLQEEKGGFAMGDVVDSLTAKLIRRNPHVFFPDGTLRPDFPATVQEIERTWREVKKTERPERTSPFDGIPSRLPALLLAAKTLKRAPATDAVAWPDTEAALGDHLLEIVRRASAAGLDPERALRGAVRRFTAPSQTPLG